MQLATGTTTTTEAIREHYDRLSPLYAALWGEHIHHGYWDGPHTNGSAEVSPATAQVNLVERLACAANVQRGARVLDVGCGLGGSAIWLATHLDCTVMGITISPVQAKIATEKARKAGVHDRVRFEVMDANALGGAGARVPHQSFDVVWIIEASEHLFDKARFFRKCFASLRPPHGTIAMCAWLAGSPKRLQASNGQSLLRNICEGMLCPSLATLDDYQRWLSDAGFDDVTADEITANVTPTWKYAAAKLDHPLVRAALSAADERTRRFAATIPLMHQAMSAGVIGFGVFTARKRVCRRSDDTNRLGKA